MKTEELYVVAYDDRGSNSHADKLVSNEVYNNIEEAKATITCKETMRVVDLNEWAEECHKSGWVDAYG